MYKCLYCGFTHEDIEFVKDHMKEEHMDEFYAEYFDDWADEMIMFMNADDCIDAVIKSQEN